MSDVVFLTGATGFLGTQIARRLLSRSDITVVALVRAEDDVSARRRLSRAWWDWPELASAIGARVEVMCGDVVLPRLGLDEADYIRLTHRITHIIHSAADLRIDAPIEELRKTNLHGVINVLEFAHATHRGSEPQHHGLARFSHISTAYVSGRRSDSVPEDELTSAHGFSNAYELSKYEGECVVQAAKTELPISVFRPAMIIGDSCTGEIKTFNTLYFPLWLYLTGQLKVLPTTRGLRVNIVPVDYVADVITHLTLEPKAEGLNFHLVAPYESLPGLDELVDFVQEWARQRLNLELPKPVFIRLPDFLIRPRYHAERTQPHDALGPSGAPTALVPYLNERVQFQRGNVDRLLGPYNFVWREVMPAILDYAVDKGFMHRSERTVHEQILYRLQSKRRPVTYHDVIEGQTVARDTVEVRREMLAAADALRALGIQPGDRVAIVGLNSTRYLTLDVAIGLVGAVSVPLYYTSPLADIEAILTASGARLLFVGAPKVLERLSELETELPIVSFCRFPPGNASHKVISWEEFLNGAGFGIGSNPLERTCRPMPGTRETREAGSMSVAPAPASFGDLATLRYTSGTTGDLRARGGKGVMFNHAHLRWMGECIAALLPWKARNAPAAYLSFLPMNHVVEGILATYSAYYLPAPVSITFLENVHDLARELPRVRPTIFFSVPRVYEKVWEGVHKSRLGQFYLSLKDGVLRRMLRPLLRWSVLRKAGFDRCAQLIVGSAPTSENLLRNFHELGIEIHNAYGLTEAPLITLNRLGANKLGTVGAPLPNTEIRIAEDGEVMVRGPQVTTGYVSSGNGVAQPFKDGWLLTGDLGCVTGEGGLVILGRKKELIKTSYGKYVQAAKVEALLREMPSVSEAMVVGEGKPYCVALLWVNDDRYNEVTAKAFDCAVLKANMQLSHPEQVKRWAILANDLSIEGGDLTANLKLKRQAVSWRLHDVIECLYGEGCVPTCVLHIGEIRREET